MKTKWVMISLAGLGLALAQPLHGANASFQLTALSLSLQPTTFTSPVPGVGVVTAYFTTYSTLRTPLYDTVGDYAVFSGELRPRASTPGVYETDYLIAQGSALTEYGYLILNFPTTDSNGNGLADFLEIGRSISLNLTGSAKSDVPVGSVATVTGTLTRDAGSTQGNYNLSLTVNGYTSTFAAQVYLDASDPAQAVLTYVRSTTTNTMSMQFRFRNPDGTLSDYSAETTFSIPNTDSITLAAFSFVGQGNLYYNVPATTLTRNGAHYTGIAHLFDGMPATSWADFRDWHIEIVDSNDIDSDGIPDLTDNDPPPPSPPAITTQPAGQTVIAGSNATFTVGVSGTAPLSYQWRKDGVAIGSAVGSSYTITNVGLSDAGNYSVVVTNSVGTATSQNANLVVHTLPVFTTQPTSQSRTVGQSVIFSAAATGFPTPTYQWRKDGFQIAGATASAYSIANVGLSDAGSYSVTASNAAGVTSSNTATLTVTEPDAFPTVTSQPSSYSIAVNGSVTFTVAVSGSPTPSIQWQRSSDNGASWIDVANDANYSGATTKTLNLSNAVLSMNGDRFRAVITNSLGSVTSNPATLTVAATAGARMINVSCLARAGTGESTLVIGFYINGTGSKTLLIRGIGPGMSAYYSGSLVPDPSITVYKDSTPVASNDNWDAALTTDFSSVGAFPLTTGSTDAALKVTLAPGLYTVHLVNTAAEADGLIEVYDLSRDLGTRLTNVSCRLNMRANQTVILGSAVIGGSVPVLARNIGPGLTPYVADPSGLLQDPELRIYSGSNEIGFNDNWDAATGTYFGPVGAFPIASGGADAALRVVAPAGGLTIHATGKGGSGVVLIELYESP